MSTSPQSLVDLEAIIDIRVIDKTFPADRCAGFFKVGAHDYKEVLGVLLLEGNELVAVFEGGGRVVDRAGANDYEKPAVGIGALNNGHRLISSV